MLPDAAPALPDAEYLVLSSRLIPGLDGGYTIATLARARQLAGAGVADGSGPQLLTFDPGTAADHTAHRGTFVEQFRRVREAAQRRRLRARSLEVGQPARLGEGRLGHGRGRRSRRPGSRSRPR